MQAVYQHGAHAREGFVLGDQCALLHFKLRRDRNGGQFFNGDSLHEPSELERIFAVCFFKRSVDCCQLTGIEHDHIDRGLLPDSARQFEGEVACFQGNALGICHPWSQFGEFSGCGSRFESLDGAIVADFCSGDFSFSEVDSNEFFHIVLLCISTRGIAQSIWLPYYS